MPKALTLKNLPDALHAYLLAASRRHRRSLNREAIVCLEAELAIAPVPAQERLSAIRVLRETLQAGHVEPSGIAAFKAEGRP